MSEHKATDATDATDVYASIQMLLEMNTDLHGKVEILTERVKQLENKTPKERARYLLLDSSTRHNDDYEFAVVLHYKHVNTGRVKNYQLQWTFNDDNGIRRLVHCHQLKHVV